MTIPSDKNLSHKDLHGLDFSGADFSKANLEYANLAGANLQEARLTNANLLGANLEGANLEYAILQGANFRQSNLKDANLADTYSVWADFRGANLNNATLERAIVEAARFEDASLENTKLHNISYNRSTCWPEDFKPHMLVMTVSPQTVTTFDDLLDFIESLSQSQAIDYEESLSLEGYLRSLWSLIQRHREETVTVNLIARLLTEAFLQEPITFDDGWHQYAIDSSDENVEGNFDYLQHTILSQIAELHIASENSQDKSLLSDWGSFSVVGYLSAAACGFQAHSKYRSGEETKCTDRQRRIGRDLNSHDCTWRDLANILELGKAYE